ncbi:MAG: ATP-dependent sacrificial sulfur transferase LarE [Phycisphaerales bacterium]|nr:MAG: ATP-dependent sacrificial sulfur transferase LarE [Phycisphaerales bacterium]
MPAPTADNSLQSRLNAVRDALCAHDRIAVAFSGGIDSTLVLKLAVDALGPQRVVAVTGVSESLAPAEFDAAKALADELGVRQIILHTDEFDNPGYTSNPTDRCYHCKTTLYRHLEAWMAGHGEYTVVSGTNADDLGDYRPGLTAAAEHRVLSPLADAGLTKADVRELAQRLGLPNHDKPASPCLSSRVPYGEPVTPEKLRMIDRAETFLRGLGFPVCRVRHHAGDAASIEVPPDDLARITSADLAARVESALRRIGYRSVTIDPRGFRSGRLNEAVVELRLAQRAG